MDNRVEIVVGAQDNSKLDLEGLKARLTELGRKVAEARVNIEDKEANAKLAMLGVRLDSLGRRAVSPKLSLQGAARVEAQLLALDVQFDRLGGKVGSRGLIQRGLSGLLNGITSLGGVGTTFINPITLALAALAAVLAGPVIAGLLPVIAGFGVLAAVAVPEITKVWAAVEKGGKAWDKLSGPQKAVGRELKDLKSQFGDLAKSVQPQILRAFATVLKIIKDLMPALKPLVKAAAKALDELLTDIDKWLKSPSGKKFIHWLETDGPKAIETFTHALWTIANIAGRVFTFLNNAGHTAGHRLSVAFAAIRAAIRALTHAFGNIVHAWGNVSHAFGNVQHAGGNVVHAFSNIGHAIGNVINFISDLIGWVESAIAAIGNLAGAVNKALGGIPGKVLGFLGLEHGGIAGAAAGRLAGGLTMVGEHGRELVRLAPGSRVHSNPDTERMLAQGGGGGGTLRLEIVGAGDELTKALAKALRHHARVSYGGSAQRAYGVG